MSKEKDKLCYACQKLTNALRKNDSQRIAEGLALMHNRMFNFIETGAISYEAIECELIKIEKGENNGRIIT